MSEKSSDKVEVFRSTKSDFGFLNSSDTTFSSMSVGTYADQSSGVKTSSEDNNNNNYFASSDLYEAKSNKPSARFVKYFLEHLNS